MTDFPFHCGKHDATPLRSGTPRYSELRSALVKDPKVSLPVFPGNFGSANVFPGDSWRMFGNGPDDEVYPGFGGCGDCTLADPAHAIMESAKTTERTIPRLTGQTVVGWYSDLTGYNPDTGENDNGANVQDILAARQTVGLKDDDGKVHKIGAIAALTPGSLQEMWEAVWLFKRATIGFRVQEAQQQQFAAGKNWDFVPGSPVVGGHDVIVMGRWGLVSWARRVGFTNRFIVNQVDEAYTYIDQETYNAVTGLNSDGFKDQDLERFIVLLARSLSK